MSNLNHSREANLFDDIRRLLQTAKSSIQRSVNTAVIQAYWQVGKYIVEYEQQGNERAEYGSGMLKRLSTALIPEFGRSFSVTNLQFMRLLYQRIQNYESLPHNLSWTHFIALLKVKDDAAMRFYLEECAAANWSTRQLERQIHTLYYERLLASRDKATVKAEANSAKDGEALTPREIIRDPYILEFIGIKQGEHFLESDLEELRNLINESRKEEEE